MTTLNRPVPFAGTEDEARKNFVSHNWRNVGDGEVVCIDCEHKPWHVGASYPCGTEAPRGNVTNDG